MQEGSPDCLIGAYRTTTKIKWCYVFVKGIYNVYAHVTSMHLAVVTWRNNISPLKKKNCVFIM